MDCMQDKSRNEFSHLTRCLAQKNRATYAARIHVPKYSYLCVVKNRSALNHTIPIETDALFSTRAKGKLLLTGEYVVLDGALSLATPVRYGQSLTVQQGTEAGILHWRSADEQGNIWFSAHFRLSDLHLTETSEQGVADTLTGILQACRRQNPTFLHTENSLAITTQNDFPRQWGLGTSSTLIAALAHWAQVNPHTVLADTLGGSGYDLACAYAEGPLWYQLQEQQPVVQEVTFNPTFKDQLWLAYLGKKQDSRAGIRQYRARKNEQPQLPEQISDLTRAFTQAGSLKEMEELIEEHEHRIGEAIDLPLVQDVFFKGFPGKIKSLGAWGGDFVLVTNHLTNEKLKNYFSERGFETVLPYESMIRGEEL
jgi:mevalonate kinase